jgi:hypothetical protein
VGCRPPVQSTRVPWATRVKDAPSSSHADAIKGSALTIPRSIIDGGGGGGETSAC